ncbi:hypothetical protein Tco_1509832 [Tanacetum coccineum]
MRHVVILEASLSEPRIATIPRIPAQYLIPIISCATCHHLSGATWPASRHRSHHWTTGQRHRANGGQWRRTTVGPLPDHRRTTGQPPVNGDQRWWLTGSGRVLGRVGIGSGLGPPCGMPPRGIHVDADVEINKYTQAESN